LAEKERRYGIEHSSRAKEKFCLSQKKGKGGTTNGCPWRGGKELYQKKKKSNTRQKINPNSTG